MESGSSPNTNNQSDPQPETLKPRADSDPAASKPATTKPSAPGRRRGYRPSHKATLIGMAVVAVILLINVAILAFVLKGKTKSSTNNNQVTISSDVLDKLGVSTNTVGSAGTKLTVGPDADFNGKVKITGNTTLAGQLLLNSKLSGTNANFTDLQAGNTALAQLNVNGNGTIGTLNLRQDLSVAGKTQLQGPVTISQLVTINNSLAVAGNLSVGGSLGVNNLSVNNLTVSGHITSGGAIPSVGPGGPALGSNGTVSVSGNDSVGTIAINIGVGATAGTLVNLAFHSKYSATPHIVFSPVGVAANFYLLNESSSGFSIGVGSGLSPGGYSLNYMVEE